MRDGVGVIFDADVIALDGDIEGAVCVAAPPGFTDVDDLGRDVAGTRGLAAFILPSLGTVLPAAMFASAMKFPF